MDLLENITVMLNKVGVTDWLIEGFAQYGYAMLALPDLYY